MFESTFPNLDVRSRIFVSYHHSRDRVRYEEFESKVSKQYKAVQDHSVRQELRSRDSEYVIRAIRERYLTNSSCTIVLCGLETARRRFVDWEICATLNKEHGLIGVLLPETIDSVYRISLPPRLYQNVESGYAHLINWHQVMMYPTMLGEDVKKAKARSKALIRNDLPRMKRSKSSKLGNFGSI